MQPTRTSFALAVVGTVAATLAMTSCDGRIRDRIAERRAERPATTAPATPVDRTPTTAPADPACVGTPATPVTHRYRDLTGVDAELTSLDVHAPAGLAPDAGCPAVVFVHGGGWRRGDKVQGAVDTKASWLNGQGVVLVSVNYRLAQPGNDVGWPDFGTDVAAAVGWVLDHAAEIGVDPDRVTLMGHSAGAHLVGIVGTHPRLLADVGHDRSELACVIELDTAADDLTDTDPLTDRLVQAAFGDDATARADASPIVQVREHPGELADFLLVTRGRDVRRAGAAAFAEALRAAGTTAEVLDANPLTHRQVNHRLGEPGDAVVTPAVERFLGDCTAPR